MQHLVMLDSGVEISFSHGLLLSYLPLHELGARHYLTYAKAIVSACNRRVGWARAKARARARAK